ncbi:MAG: GNAT family N-acetyltransferase [Anaerolineae bacterium]
MKVNYRLAEERDLKGVHHIMVESLDQFALQMGRPLVEVDFEDYLPLWYHFLATSDEGFWVAEVRGKLTGFVCSIVRDGLWFLSHLMVLPEFQGQGIGGELLAKTLQGAQRGEVKIIATYADASNWPSISLYARHGMFPRVPVLHMRGSIISMRLDQREAEPPEFQVAGLSEEMVTTLGEIDEKTRGAKRHIDHRYWLGAPGMRCYLFRERKRAIAYAYLSDEGHIGPLATLKGEYMRPILGFAIDRLSDQGVDTFIVRVPGINTEAVSLLYERGFTIHEMHLLMASLPFGHWENYIISRPSLL